MDGEPGKGVIVLLTKAERLLMKHSSWISLLLLVVCVGPALYWAHIVAVIIHEVVGHGMVALVLGGEFIGATISPDAFGWAYAYIPADAENYVWKEILLLMGGSVSTWFAGVAVAVLLHKASHLSAPARLTGTLLAYALLTEGTTYLLFTSIVPTGGDWAEVLRLWGNPVWARILFIIIGAGLVLTSVWWCLYSVLRCWAVVVRNRGINGRGWIMAPGILVVLPSFTFDWDQLAPGLWQWPNLTMLVIHLIVSVLIVRHGFLVVPEEAEKIQLKCGWSRVGVLNTLAAMSLFALCWFVLRHELLWGTA